MRWLCGVWHRMVVQHCIDCSGVAVALQSRPYRDSGIVSATMKTTLAAEAMDGPPGVNYTPDMIGPACVRGTCTTGFLEPELSRTQRQVPLSKSQIQCVCNFTPNRANAPLEGHPGTRPGGFADAGCYVRNDPAAVTLWEGSSAKNRGMRRTVRRRVLSGW